MIQQWLNWRTFLTVVAIFIVLGTVIYSQHLAEIIGKDETRKIEQWAEAVKLNSNPNINANNLSSRILAENSTDIPIIVVTEKDSILDYRNIDTIAIKKNKLHLNHQIQLFKKLHPPIDWRNPLDTLQLNRVYYGESKLLNEIRYYPIVQLLVVAIFIIILIVAQRLNYQSTSQQLWVGMAKETAHQLGTPVTSLGGWLELLKEYPINKDIVPEIEKDVHRLQLISDRFGKIGSTPKVEPCNIVFQIENMVQYIRKRASGKVSIEFDKGTQSSILINLSPPLFDWVIENLLKNALDAMEGMGKIVVALNDHPKYVTIDVTDSGKGISKSNISKVFKPGFTTKKRGWGLGLTLSKRIIESYHKGQIFVKHSDLHKGTTFRIVLNK